MVALCHVPLSYPAPLEALLRRVDATDREGPERPWRVREAVTGILRFCHIVTLGHYYNEPAIRTKGADAAFRDRLARPLADGGLLRTLEQVPLLRPKEDRYPVLNILREFIDESMVVS
jgi:hypothetical protein